MNRMKFGAVFPALAMGLGLLAATPAAASLAETELTVSDASPNDGFGIAVGLSADTVVVGSPLEDDTASNSGAAYVYTPDGSGGYNEAKLKAGDAAMDDGFGTAVAVDRDTVVVGVPLDDDAGTSAGSAYVYTPDGVGGSATQVRHSRTW